MKHNIRKHSNYKRYISEKRVKDYLIKITLDTESRWSKWLNCDEEYVLPIGKAKIEFVIDDDVFGILGIVE